VSIRANALWAGWPKLSAAFVVGGLLGFGASVYQRSGELEVLKPAAIAWNGHSLPLPMNGGLVAWPELSPFYSVRLADRSKAGAETPTSTIYYVLDEFAQLTEWPKRSFDRARRSAVSLGVNSAGIAREMHCYRQQMRDPNTKLGQLRLYVTVDGFDHSIGYIGSQKHLQEYLVEAIKALETLQITDEPARLLRRCFESSSSPPASDEHKSDGADRRVEDAAILPTESAVSEKH
jgi:hypothetical protein